MLNVQASIDSVKAMFCSIIGYGNMFISTCSTQRAAGPSGGGATSYQVYPDVCVVDRKIYPF